MAQDWFVTMNGQQTGPISPQQLKQLASSGQLQPTDTVWKEGMAQWVPASSIKGLPFTGGAITAVPNQMQAPQRQMTPAPQRQMTPAPAGPVVGLSKNFQFDGTASDFFVTGLLCVLLSIIPLIGPAMAVCKFQTWRAEHTIIQGRRLKFTGNFMELFVKLLVGILLILVTCQIYLFWFIPSMQKWIAEHTDFADA